MADNHGDSNMMALWFDGDCIPNVLIDNDDLSNSEESDNDYEKDFVINEWKIITAVSKRQIDVQLGNTKHGPICKY